MVWGCFSWHGLGPLLVIDGSIPGETYTQLLEEHVYPTMLVMFDGVENGIFQDDNAPPHRSRTAQAKVEAMGIDSRMGPTQPRFEPQRISGIISTFSTVPILLVGWI